MPPALCLYCGKPAHSTGTDFDCPGRSDGKTIASGAPAFTPAPEVDEGQGSLSTSSELGLSYGSRLSLGTLVGEYEILDRIGEGGMGTVYSAVQPVIGKKVAIKVLASKLANNQNAVRRFVLEARAVNDIQHPGLVDIFSFGRLPDGRHYYVMEFLDGGNLGDLLSERGPLPQAEAIPIFLDVGRALVAVHAKGIVHRDLKPENILLLAPLPGERQKVKLVDFGLAKLLEGVPERLRASGPRTAAGVNVGTPHYMSPEQCRSLRIDARSDLYSLGVVLYETLTGHLPILGRSALDIWQAHAEVVPRRPVEVAPGAVSGPMSEVIMRLLEKLPERRLQSAAEFCAALECLGTDALPGRITELGSDSTTNLGGLEPAAPGMPLFAEVSVQENRKWEREDMGFALELQESERPLDTQKPVQTSAPGFHRPSRPAEERSYVPPLAAHTPRSGAGMRPMTISASRQQSVALRVFRSIAVVSLLIAATVIAVWFAR